MINIYHIMQQRNKIKSRAHHYSNHELLQYSTNGFTNSMNCAVGEQIKVVP